MERQKPDEWRICACGRNVGVWRGREHLSLSHPLPLCADYDGMDDDGAGGPDAYLRDRTTPTPAASDDTAAPAAATDDTAPETP